MFFNLQNAIKRNWQAKLSVSFLLGFLAMLDDLLDGIPCLEILPVFLYSSFCCFVIWSASEEIYNQINQQFEWQKNVLKKITMLSLSNFIGIGILTTILCYLATPFFGRELSASIFFQELVYTLLVTTAITAIYIGHDFFSYWKKSITELEELKKENTQAQLDSLRNQINPHFLFNSLNTLVSIIPDCPETAIDFTQKLSNVYRYLLSVREKELVELQTELDFIQSYIFLLKVRFEQNLIFEIEIPEELKTRLLPPVSLQLLIENAIKHNVVSREKPLYIQIYVENDFLIVKNNLQAKLEKEASTGIGLENISKRYQILSTKRMEVIHSSTHFTIALPLLTD